MLIGETAVITDKDTTETILDKMLDMETCVVLDLRSSIKMSLENLVAIAFQDRKAKAKETPQEEPEKPTRRFF